MKLKAYEHVFLVNQGYDQVARSLKALARYPALRPDEIAQFAQRGSVGLQDDEHCNSSGPYSRPGRNKTYKHRVVPMESS
jgi:hypothetical protein